MHFPPLQRLSCWAQEVDLVSLQQLCQSLTWRLLIRLVKLRFSFCLVYTGPDWFSYVRIDQPLLQWLLTHRGNRLLVCVWSSVQIPASGVRSSGWLSVTACGLSHLLVFSTTWCLEVEKCYGFHHREFFDSWIPHRIYLHQLWAWSWEALVLQLGSPASWVVARLQDPKFRFGTILGRSSSYIRSDDIVTFFDCWIVGQLHLGPVSHFYYHDYQNLIHN